MAILAHTRFGDGKEVARPALVFLHGFLGAGRNLASLAKTLAARTGRLALTFDLTGHGVSPTLREGADLASMGADVRETCRALGIERPEVIGHSLGGRVALAALAAEPAWASKLTLLDITPGVIAGDENAGVTAALLAAPATVATREEGVRALMAGGLSRPIADWLAMNLERAGDGEGEGDVYRWRIDREALAALRPRVNAEDLWPAVERAVCPIAVIRGGDSRYVSDADLARMAAAGVETHTLVGAGHFVHVDRLGEVVELVAG